MTQATTETLRLSLLADPGLPTRRAETVRKWVYERLDEELDINIDLSIETRFLRLDPDNRLSLDQAEDLDSDKADVTVLMTELPRYVDSKPLVAEIFPNSQVGVISCPTLGAPSSARKIRRAIVETVLRLRQVEHSEDPLKFGVVLDSDWSYSQENNSQLLYASTTFGSVRLVAGMVAANDPWRTAPRLSSALAAASATGAFGIFYNSIWEMAEYLSTARLALISVMAVAAMVVWLILSNGLWDRPRHKKFSGIVILYNLSTILTLLICVVSLYGILVLLIFAGGMIVIDPEFMETIIGVTPGFGQYLQIAWISAAMGVVAGALGSSFDNTVNVRQVTHGQRERQREYTETSDSDQEPGDSSAEDTECSHRQRADSDDASSSEEPSQSKDDNDDADNKEISVNDSDAEPERAKAPDKSSNDNEGSEDAKGSDDDKGGADDSSKEVNVQSDSR